MTAEHFGSEEAVSSPEPALVGEQELRERAMRIYERRYRQRPEHASGNMALFDQALAYVVESYATVASVQRARESYWRSMQQLLALTKGRHDRWAQETLDLLVAMHDAAEEVLREKEIDIPLLNAVSAEVA